MGRGEALGCRVSPGRWTSEMPRDVESRFGEELGFWRPSLPAQTEPLVGWLWELHLHLGEGGQALLCWGIRSHGGQTVNKIST